MENKVIISSSTDELLRNQKIEDDTYKLKNDATKMYTHNEVNYCLIRRRRTDTYEIAETVIACTMPTQVYTRHNPTPERRKWNKNPTPHQESICYWDLLGKGKSVFSQWRIPTTPQDKSDAQNRFHGFPLIFILV